MQQSVRALLRPDSRRAIRLHQPAVQLKLPLYLLGVTSGFALLFACNLHAAFGNLYANSLSMVPDSMQDDVIAQARVFLGVSAVIAVGWICAVMAVCLAYTRRLIGPLVALQRQIRALTRGDCSELVRVRDEDPVFRDVADDLNALTRKIGSAGRPRARPADRSPLGILQLQ